MIKPEVRIVQYWDDTVIGGGAYMYSVEVRQPFLWVFRYWAKQKATPLSYKAVAYAEELYALLEEEYSESINPKQGKPDTAKTVIWRRPEQSRVKGIGKPV